jgi:hypothetical protein
MTFVSAVLCVRDSAATEDAYSTICHQPIMTFCSLVSDGDSSDDEDDDLHNVETLTSSEDIETALAKSCRVKEEDDDDDTRAAAVIASDDATHRNRNRNRKKASRTEPLNDVISATEKGKVKASSCTVLHQKSHSDRSILRMPSYRRHSERKQHKNKNKNSKQNSQSFGQKAKNHASFRDLHGGDLEEVRDVLMWCEADHHTIMCMS